jgi:hypothetical protein
MGLITGLLLLPLAPVSGTVWIAERLLEAAEEEYYSESAIRAQLAEIERLRDAGEIDDEEAARTEDMLVVRLLSGRG